MTGIPGPIAVGVVYIVAHTTKYGIFYKYNYFNNKIIHFVELIILTPGLNAMELKLCSDGEEILYSEYNDMK